MRLDEFPLDAPVIRKPPKGSPGKETAWLEFCDLELRGGALLVTDPTYGPSADDGLLVELPKGRYLLHAKVMEYGDDRRISRLRVCLQGAEPSLGDAVGTAGADSGQIGVCDHAAFAAAWGSDAESGWAKIEPSLWKEHGLAVLDCESGAIMPYVSSGFGDGEFPVYGLLGPEGLVGVEVEFIAPTETYPID